MTKTKLERRILDALPGGPLWLHELEVAVGRRLNHEAGELKALDRAMLVRFSPGIGYQLTDAGREMADRPRSSVTRTPRWRATSYSGLP